MIHDVALIISDQRMPEMTGLDFLIRSAEMRPHCVRIILTGYTDAIALVDALNSGVVYKYVTKPWVNSDLFQTIKRGLAHHETTKAQHHLKLENERLRDRVRASDACFLRLCNELQYLKNEDFLYRATRTRNLAEAIARARELQASTIRPPVTANEKLCAKCSLAPVCLPEEARLRDRETGRINAAPPPSHPDAQPSNRKALRLFPADDDRQALHIDRQRHGAGLHQLAIAAASPRFDAGAQVEWLIEGSA